MNRVQHTFYWIMAVTLFIHGVYGLINPSYKLEKSEYECTMIDVRDDTCTEYSLIRPPKHEKRVK